VASDETKNVDAAETPWSSELTGAGGDAEKRSIIANQEGDGVVRRSFSRAAYR